ncbi:hypothetical protein [Limnoglobus roseus]|uniref:Uncharacterized protein n=1 Tax=Limnoglobus roseus TaxID=2598579 RepID=A0A5C1AC35_9BACT|nr:hypothetical protein [Limnoglobus roseus]QEL16939.1 hypothetical protein PX52LOC_03915 [Limnoglobus roseus]
MTTTLLMIPVTSVGFGTGTVSVRDAKTGLELTLNGAGAVLRRGVVYLPAESLGTEGLSHLVRFADGVVAWVAVGEGVEEGVGCAGCAA